MSPILPDFTVHDFLKRGTDQLKKEIIHHLGVPPEVFSDTVLDEEISIEDTKKIYPDLINKIKETTNEWLMTPVNKSSNILEIGWKENKCRVRFKNLKLFEYEPIDSDLWLNFLVAKSKGEFFSKHIRNNKDIKSKRIL